MKKVTILLVLFLSFTYTNAQISVGDATLPEKVTFNNEELVMNGAGLREKFFFDIYAGALYVKKKNKSAASIASADETMAIKLYILSGMMSRSKMEDALREGFDRATNSNTKALDARIDKFVGFVSDEIEVGQTYDLVYEQGKGSVIYKNGQEKGFVEGLDFKKALFDIWIGQKPADKGLKAELLGVF
ncbi:chalcone isomerase family protein [Aquimarina sp. W85]|uniref:chalcone isomerase family protein n=1 Tax=Aquimarina rhodophyticola TaxID=3342246 RepID=UPI00366D46D7